MKKLPVFISMGILLCIFGLLGTACNEVEPDVKSPKSVQHIKIEAGISDDDFSRYLNLQNIDKTIPVVNSFLDNISKDLSVGEKARLLVEFYKSFAGIIDARAVSNEHMRTPIVFFSFMDGGTERELALDFSSTGKVLSYHYDVVKGAYVKTKRFFTINEVFDFINSLEFEVHKIYDGVYVSGLPSSEENLQYVLDGLNARSYTNDGNAWRTTGYLHYQTGQITIFPHLFGIKNVACQTDWLEAMEEYSLTETFDYDHSGYIVVFEIPEDATIPQSHWEDFFAKYDFVEWAEMSCNRYTLSDMSIGGGNENTAVDSRINIKMVELSDTAPQTLSLYCATEKVYSSGSNPIIVVKQQSQNSIDISFKGVAEIGMTADIGPARATIDLGALNNGTYNLNLHNGDVKRTGKLIVTDKSYTIEFADNTTFRFASTILRKNS